MYLAKFRKFVGNYWQVALSIVVGIAAAVAFLLYRLKTMLPLASSPEQFTIMTGREPIRAILDNPLNAPYKVLQYAGNLTHQHSLFFTRSISAAFGLLAVILVFYILQKWHSTFMAILGTFLFVSSSWFLAYARLATPEITSILVLSAIAYGVWFKTAKRSLWMLILGLSLMILMIYTPGLIWFVLLALLWQRKALARKMVYAPKTTAFGVILTALVLAPLAFAIIGQHDLLKGLFGFTGDPLDAIGLLGTNLVEVFDQLALHGQSNPVYGLVGLPLLDIFVIVMSLLGAYAYILQYKLDRAKVVFGGFVVGALLAALQGTVSIIILAPFVYILATAGVAYMLGSWYTVFPRNPLARNIGLALILSLVFITGFYHIQRYYVAWPNAPETVHVFTISQ